MWAILKEKQFNTVTGITPDVPEGSKVIDAYEQDGYITLVWLWSVETETRRRKHVLLPTGESILPQQGWPRYIYQDIVIDRDGKRFYLFETIGENLDP